MASKITQVELIQLRVARLEFELAKANLRAFVAELSVKHQQPAGSGLDQATGEWKPPAQPKKPNGNNQ